MSPQSTINHAQDFEPSNFPLVVKEIAEIKERMKPLRHVDNEIIIVSYLKDHSIRSDLARSHPEIVKVLTSKETCRHLEDLFLISEDNTQFRLSLENYIIEQLNK